MAESRKVTIRVEFDDAGAIRSVKTLDKSLDDVAKTTGRAQKGMSTFGDTLKAIISAEILKTGFRLLVGGLKDAVGAAIEAERATALLNSALQNQGRFTPALSASIQNYSDELRDLTGVSDEAITTGQALLVGFGLQGEALRRATRLSLDFATVMNVDTDAAFKTVGKAAIGYTEMLKRMGIATSEGASRSQKAEEALAQLERRMGGAAAAAGQTFGGQLKIASERLDEVLERVGLGLTPALNLLLRALGGAAGGLEGFGASLTNLSNRLLAPIRLLMRLIQLASATARLGPSGLGVFMSFSGTGRKLKAFEEEIDLELLKIEADIASLSNLKAPFAKLFIPPPGPAIVDEGAKRLAKLYQEMIDSLGHHGDPGLKNRIDKFFAETFTGPSVGKLMRQAAIPAVPPPTLELGRLRPEPSSVLGGTLETPIMQVTDQAKAGIDNLVDYTIAKSKMAHGAISGLFIGLAGSLANLFTDIGAGAEAPLRKFFASIIGMLGDFAIQLGTYMITLATASIALRTIFLAPGAAIAAGIALIAIGGLIKGFGARLGGGVGAGSSFQTFPRSTAGGPATPVAFNVNPFTAAAMGGTAVWSKMEARLAAIEGHLRQYSAAGPGTVMMKGLDETRVIDRIADRFGSALNLEAAQRLAYSVRG